MPTRYQLIRYCKIFGSLLIVLHVIAIAAAPASVPPATPLTQRIHSIFRPYLQFGFLNHGYHFFAPDPGSSSLLEYTVVDEKGQQKWGRLPDRDVHWPRLLYHRHFMLTEFYGSIPPHQKDLRTAVAASYAHQILREEGGVSVELSLVTHQLSSRQEILSGQLPTDPKKYDIERIGRFELKEESQP
ncbi:MAG: hypothetical protein AAF483_17530 [Planctomycetota bacterium]